MRKSPAQSEPVYIISATARVLGMMSIILMPFFGYIGPILPFFGVIVSVISLTLANRYHAPCSRSMAMTGLITSIAGLVIFAGWTYHFMNDSHKSRCQAACLSNSKQIGLAMRLYADDNDGILPSTKKWQRHLLKYAYRETVFQCPTAKEAKYSYGMNTHIGSVSERKLANPTQTVAAFDCSLPTVSASGKREVVDFRHLFHGNPGLANIIFTDGHAQAMSEQKPDQQGVSSIDQLRWKP